MPPLHAVLTNNFFRGAVSGLGLINVLAALAELGDMFGSRAGRASAPEDSGQIGNPHAR